MTKFNALEIRHLHKSYKRGFIPKSFPVLEDLSFSVKAGSITGFLGQNGAGKTTLIKSVLGLLRPDKGEVLFFQEQPLSSEVLRNVGFLPEQPYFYDYLTGRELLIYYGQLSGLTLSAAVYRRMDELLERLGLSHAKDRALRTYSKGMLQKIGLAQAILHEPKLLVLDEPMSGLDPDGRMIVADLIREIAAQGTTIFFSSHLLADVEKLCDRVVMIREGKLVFEGQLSDLLEKTQRGFEIIYAEGGVVRSQKTETITEQNLLLGELLARSVEIREVRPIRQSLEEIFIEKAIRGPVL